MPRRAARPTAAAQRLLEPEQRRCWLCDGPLWVAYHSRRTVTTLEGLVALTLVVRTCRNRDCARFHQPYHAAIAAEIDAALALGIDPVLISLHSFTPHWKGVARPWHAGILWDEDHRVAHYLLAALRADAGLVVGDNEPYSGSLEGDTLYTHGTRLGLRHGLIEIRPGRNGGARVRRPAGDELTRQLELFIWGRNIAAEHLHHHVVCISCGAVVHVHDETVRAALQKVARESGYALADEELTFRGFILSGLARRYGGGRRDSWCGTQPIGDP